MRLLKILGEIAYLSVRLAGMSVALIYQKRMANGGTPLTAVIHILLITLLTQKV